MDKKTGSIDPPIDWGEEDYIPSVAELQSSGLQSTIKALAQFQDRNRDHENLMAQEKLKEEHRANRHSRHAKSQILWIFLVLASIVTVFGLRVFFNGSTLAEKNAGISSAIAAMTAIGGLAAGIGLR
jgi:hypothetical protein